MATKNLKFYSLSEEHYQKIKGSLPDTDTGGHLLESDSFYITTSNDNMIENANLYFGNYKITDFISLNQLLLDSDVEEYRNITPNLNGSNIPTNLGIENKIYYWIDPSKTGYTLQLYYYNNKLNTFIGLRTKSSTQESVTVAQEDEKVKISLNSSDTVTVPSISSSMTPKDGYVLTYESNSQTYIPKTNSSSKVTILTLAEYEDMKSEENIDENTVYYVRTPNNSVNMYLGSIEITNSKSLTVISESETET